MLKTWRDVTFLDEADSQYLWVWGLFISFQVSVDMQTTQTQLFYFE